MVKIIFRNSTVEIQDTTKHESTIIPKERWDLWEQVNRKLKEYFNHGKKTKTN
jgi:hypothetical protein